MSLRNHEAQLILIVLMELKLQVMEATVVDAYASCSNGCESLTNRCQFLLMVLRMLLMVFMQHYCT